MGEYFDTKLIYGFIGSNYQGSLAFFWIRVLHSRELGIRIFLIRAHVDSQPLENIVHSVSYLLVHRDKRCELECFYGLHYVVQTHAVHGCVDKFR